VRTRISLRLFHSLRWSFSQILLSFVDLSLPFYTCKLFRTTARAMCRFFRVICRVSLMGRCGVGIVHRVHVSVDTGVRCCWWQWRLHNWVDSFVVDGVGLTVESIYRVFWSCVALRAGNMVKHNNVIPNGHFKKDWQNYVRTWFNQPARKKRRRTGTSTYYSIRI